MIHHAGLSKEECSWPPILGLFKSLTVALTYLRMNHVQAELGEYFKVSQPTISRAVSGLTVAITRVLHDWVPVAEDLDEDTQFITDGSLLPLMSVTHQVHVLAAVSLLLWGELNGANFH